MLCFINCPFKVIMKLFTSSIFETKRREESYKILLPLFLLEIWDSLFSLLLSLVRNTIYINTYLYFCLFVSIIVFIFDCLHQLIKLSNLLVWFKMDRHSSVSCFSSLAGMMGIRKKKKESKKQNKPFIFSIFALSNFSPVHESPSSFWAYSCHSVKNPIYIYSTMWSQPWPYWHM